MWKLKIHSKTKSQKFFSKLIKMWSFHVGFSVLAFSTALADFLHVTHPQMKKKKKNNCITSAGKSAYEAAPQKHLVALCWRQTHPDMSSHFPHNFYKPVIFQAVLATWLEWRIRLYCSTSSECMLLLLKMLYNILSLNCELKFIKKKKNQAFENKMPSVLKEDSVFWT